MYKKLNDLFFDKSGYGDIYCLFLIKLIGRFIKRGNMEKGLKFLFKLKYLLKKKSKREPTFILLISLLKGLFKFYFIRKRLGSTIKELPMPLLPDRQVRKATQLLFKLAKSKRNKLVSLRNLTNLLIRTAKRKGLLIRYNNKNYRKALDNRVFLFLIKR